MKKRNETEPNEKKSANTGFIGEDEIKKALTVLSSYKDGKRNLENRIIENDKWFRMRYRESTGGADDECRKASAWLFNSIANKHADAMDNYPSVCCLPREPGDAAAAQQLSQILPVIFERNSFEETYSDAWWYKLKAGTAVYGIFWDERKNGGAGDIEIKRIDILNLFWEPGIRDINDSSNVFHIELIDNDVLSETYPILKGKLGNSSLEISHFVYDDTVNTDNKSAVVDWYYKKTVDGITRLHYCKFCNETVLYASENDEMYRETGFYDHGEYPFVFDRLFCEEGSPCGFGYVDIMKDAQNQIDILGSSIVRNAVMATTPRYFINSSGAVNEEEFADWSQSFVHVNGSNLGEDSIREIKLSHLPDVYLGVLNCKIDELKETSGNRDFSQGGVTSGVTAASAIAALQEAGGKLTRDMVKGGYRAFCRLNALAVELIRQFYTEPRFFRILDSDGEAQFASFDNSAVVKVNQGELFGVPLGERKPIFDIKISGEKSSPFSKLGRNELALQLYNAGLFLPENREQALITVGMMDFEGKAELLGKLGANGGAAL